MKIEQHISQLLYRYQCVTVPGFGAFLAETHSAQLNEMSNSFYPPKTVISFNANLRHNDGLLANHIARTEKTTYDEALASIQSEVTIWRQILEINQKFSLKNIGELSLNAEGNFVFKPHEQQNYLKDSFGLTSFVSPVIKREVLQVVAPEAVHEEPIALPAPVKKQNHFYKYAAAAAVLLSVGGVFGLKWYNNHIHEQTLAVRSEVQKEVQEQIQEATFVIDNPMAPVTMTLGEEKLPYHVVAGAFRMESNADKVCRKLSRKGFKARKLEPNQYGLYPVLYQSYPSYRDAYNAMKTIREKENPDAWLLVKELN